MMSDNLWDVLYLQIKVLLFRLQSLSTTKGVDYFIPMRTRL
jgi:hypothetical protein